MALVEINWKPSGKELRVFALLLLLFGLGIACLLHRRDAGATASLIVLGVAGLGLVGLLLPELVRPVYVVWMALALPIGWTVSHLMMMVVFYCVMTPIGVMMRLVGRDPMNRRIDRAAQSYWTRRSPDADLKRYFRQY